MEMLRLFFHWLPLILSVKISFSVCSLSLYLFTISLENKKHLTVTNNLIIFSKHKD